MCAIMPMYVHPLVRRQTSIGSDPLTHTHTLPPYTYTSMRPKNMDNCALLDHAQFLLVDVN